MSDPTRLKVLKALTASLEQITPANGYSNNLTGAVFRGRAYFGSDDPLPMVAISEPPVPTDDPNEGAFDNTKASVPWDIIIQGFVQLDKENPIDPAHVLAAEVRKVLAAERARKSANGRDSNILGLGPVVDKLSIGSLTVRPSDNISSTAYFWLFVKLTILEDLIDPMG